MISAVRVMNHRARRIAGSLALLAIAGCLDVNDNQEGLAVLAIVSGNQQTLQAGGAAVPLVVRAYNASAVALQGVGVSWAVVSGGGSITPSSNQTDDTGTASVNYTPPATVGAGAVQVRASAEGLSVTFNIIITAASG
jgi:hypothetical protein